VVYAGIVRRLWSGKPVTTVGKGRVIASHDVEAVLGSSGVGPDFEYSKPQSDSRILFVHRAVPEGQLYFVNNRRNRAEAGEARFRVTGMRPEIWHADSGRIDPVSYRIEANDTVVSLDFAAEDAFFVVFREPSQQKSQTVLKPNTVPVATLSGPWDVSFQPGRGAPPSVRLNSLTSLTGSTDVGIRYFSGIATYVTHFTQPDTVSPGTPLILDLGKVGDVAEVKINGTSVGTVWKAPWRLEVGPALQPGRNEIEIRVADLWVNRLIADAQPGAAKITFTTLPTYRPDAPLRPSGLIGPVQLLAVVAPKQ
jgi:hypothetical protein